MLFEEGVDLGWWEALEGVLCLRGEAARVVWLREFSPT